MLITTELIHRHMIKKFIQNNKQLSTGIFLNFFHLSSIQVSNMLLQLLLFPVIIRVTGLAAFGHVMVANAYASLMTIGINYGTNQSGIKDIALNKNIPGVLSEKFYRIFHARFVFFIVSLLVLPFLQVFGIHDLRYYVFATTLLFAEALNPIFFFIGVEKLFAFNLANLVSKVISILLIILLVKGSSDAYMVNFYLGLSNIAIYLPLTIYAVQRYKIGFCRPRVYLVWDFIKENFSLFINSTSGYLQQSVFLFTLSYAGDPLVLGAYALCDKMVSSFRLLIISFSSAIYPGATRLYHEYPGKWKAYKNRINRVLTYVFLAAAAVLLIMPGFIVTIFIGEKNALGESYIRAIAFVPLIIALNSLNLLELLMGNAYKAISRVSLVILTIAGAISFILAWLNNPNYFAYFPLLIETACLLLYLAYLKRNPASFNL